MTLDSRPWQWGSFGTFIQRTLDVKNKLSPHSVCAKMYSNNYTFYFGENDYKAMNSSMESFVYIMSINSTTFLKIGITYFKRRNQHVHGLQSNSESPVQ